MKSHPTEQHLKDIADNAEPKTNVVQVEICMAVRESGGLREETGWYFNGIAGNGEIVSTSELYTTQEHAIRGAEGVFPGVKQIIEDEEG